MSDAPDNYKSENRMLREALRTIGVQAGAGAIRDLTIKALDESAGMARERAAARREALVKAPPPRYFRYVKPRWWQRNPLLRLLVEEVTPGEGYDLMVRGGGDDGA